ncbi:MAG: hypothetical protein R3174_08440 [Gammaproteobacteria bacterium]|nr:hypothetical protein [Gammaproteobacteria bacterium]
MSGGIDLGSLEALLSRARRIPLDHEHGGPDDLCFGVFGWRRSADRDWPTAAVTRFADLGTRSRGYCLRADPVHLRADMSDLVLLDGHDFALSLEESRSLAEEIGAHFAGAGWRIEVPHPSRWYLEVPQPPEIRTTPLSEAVFRPVQPNLPTGQEAGAWHARMNEAQMVLHRCRVNEIRAGRGEAAINSLWFWGGGELPQDVPRFDGSVFADTPLAAGLAGLAGASSRELPDRGAEILLAGPEPETVLVMIEAGHRPARASDVEGWREFIAWLETRWLAPLGSSLRQGQLDQLTIVTDRPVRFDASAPGWRARLGRNRTFAELAET